MLSGLKSALGLGGQTDFERSFMAESNVGVMRYQAVFLSLLSLVLFATTYVPMVPWKNMGLETLTNYRVGFALVMAASLAANVFCRRIHDRLADNPRLAAIGVAVYICAIVGVATTLAVAEYPVTESLFVYMVALVLMFGLLFVPPAFTLLLLLACTVVIIGGLAAQGYHGFVLRMTLYSYAFLVVAVSASTYHSRVRTAKAHETIADLSFHDDLTGVKNRRALDAEVESLLGEPLFLLLGDIDEFKFYNDSFGHAAGDAILREFARCMTGAFGRDGVYRVGGDEFVAIMRTADRPHFEAAVEAWRCSFVDLKVGEETFSPTTSGGYIFGTPQSAADLRDMMKFADSRLYDAKQAGRNTVLGISYEAARADEEEIDDMLAAPQHRMGDVDALTGLPSMTYFNLHAKTVVESPALVGATFHFVYFNVANLKIYNARYGFQGGDELLKFVARCIEWSFDHALVSRFGDDRFVLLTYGDDLAAGIDRVHDAVRAFNEESLTEVRAGVYRYEPGVEISAACDRAKLACDQLKGHYNKYRLEYDESMLIARNRRQLILDRFDEALEKGHIRAYYQSIVRCADGTTCESEALARWIDPEGGVISPADFIPVLEEFRLVHRMDLHMVERVCLDYRDMVEAGLQPVPINVNLSRYDLELCDVVSEIDRLLALHGVPHDAVHVEITESAFAENSQLLSDVIERFHRRGMQVWMDDFGSGYSSLNVLREFDFDTVKIDMRLLQHADEQSQSRSRSMMPHLMSMISDLGMHTLVEGVETLEQFEYLKGIGCEKVQGFVFSKPAAPEDIRATILSLDESLRTDAVAGALEAAAEGGDR